jgi:hypothetical protein
MVHDPNTSGNHDGRGRLHSAWDRARPLRFRDAEGAGLERDYGGGASIARAVGRN